MHETHRLTQPLLQLSGSSIRAGERKGRGMGQRGKGGRRRVGGAGAEK